MNAPKFKKGDWIKSKNSGKVACVVMLLETCYSLRMLSDNDSYCLVYSYQDNWELTDAPPKNNLEEAAREYSDQQIPVDYPDYFCRKNIEEAFKAGAKWQTGQLLKGSPLPEDTVLFQKGVEESKRLMMEEAVEGEVVEDINNKLAVTAKINLDGFKSGDMVRIIIVKEDSHE